MTDIKSQITRLEERAFALKESVLVWHVLLVLIEKILGSFEEVRRVNNIKERCVW